MTIETQDGHLRTELHRGELRMVVYERQLQAGDFRARVTLTPLEAAELGRELLEYAEDNSAEADHE